MTHSSWAPSVDDDDDDDEDDDACIHIVDRPSSYAISARVLLWLWVPMTNGHRYRLPVVETLEPHGIGSPCHRRALAKITQYMPSVHAITGARALESCGHGHPIHHAPNTIPEKSSIKYEQFKGSSAHPGPGPPVSATGFFWATSGTHFQQPQCTKVSPIWSLFLIPGYSALWGRMGRTGQDLLSALQSRSVCHAMVKMSMTILPQVRDPVRPKHSLLG
mmetsp:Transcript_107218/g.181154  ORF Transcript_107218/g.181154 Transcript_107218/m.181154 type:complete len:219 (+) Transcript_107218:1422-2078(+)